MSNYPSGYNEPESLDHYLQRLEDGEPCYHPGCLNHVTHPCEGCGRVAGKRAQKSVELSDREWAAQPANLREGCTVNVPGVGDV